MAALALAGCGLAPDPVETENRIGREPESIPSIPPGDLSTAYLDSGAVAFKVDSTNDFEFSYVTGRPVGGMGSSSQHQQIKVKTWKLGDSALEIRQAGES